MSQKRKPKLIEAVFSFLLLIILMAVAIIVYEADPHIPMLLGTAIAAMMALRLGYTWQEVEEAMVKGITRALQSLMILAIIGVLIGTWVLAGVVPSMIYYGLQVINPTFFLVTALLISSITSLATGSSWGTAGTIGIALMGVASGLEIPAPMVAGAIISGAYFGDKMSPLSDTTNLAPAMAGTDVFTHVKYMALSSGIPYIISVVIFLIIGLQFGGENAELEGVQILVEGIADNFTVSPILLLPPVIVIIAVAFKVPAIPGLFIGALLGMVLAPIFQGANLGDILSAGMYGYVSETGVEAIDTLLTIGGLGGMMYSISLTIIAMMFGGIMEETDQLEVIVNTLLKFVNSVGALVSMTLLTGIFSNITMPEQYISIVIPGRMYAETYRKKDLHPKTLSLTLETGGTLSSALIPWNTCGAFMYSVLGVSAISYAPYAFFNYLAILFVAVLGFFESKLVITKRNEEPDTVSINYGVD